MSMSSDLCMELLDHVFGCGGRDYTSPTKIFLAVSRADPSDAINEPSDSAYERLETITTDWDVAKSGGSENATLQNATVFLFSDATEGWGLITHFALFDAQSAGTRLGQGKLTTARTISVNDALKFPVSDLDVSLGQYFEVF